MNFHESMMSIAIDFAKKGAGNVSPNPLVGCVLVKNGDIIGEGWHNEFGGPHAEVNAVLNSRSNPVNSTAYVTLEPCCHVGKTSACTQFLYENGIKEVYFGAFDPNPLVSGKGYHALENLGITVHSGVLEKECSDINLGYNKWIKYGIPYVICKVAKTSDNKMGLNNKSQTKITGYYADQEVHKMRDKVDAIMVGKNTAIIDNPHLTVRHIEGKNPLRIIVDTNRTLPLNLNVFRDKLSDTLILCTEKKFRRHRTSFGTFIPVLESKNGQLEPKSILESIGKEGVTSLLIEGGPTLINSFLEENLIDKYYEFISIENLDSGTLMSPKLNHEYWYKNEVTILGQDKCITYLKKELCLQES